MVFCFSLVKCGWLLLCSPSHELWILLILLHIGTTIGYGGELVRFACDCHLAFSLFDCLSKLFSLALTCRLNLVRCHPTIWNGSFGTCRICDPCCKCCCWILGTSTRVLRSFLSHEEPCPIINQRAIQHVGQTLVQRVICEKDTVLLAAWCLITGVIKWRST